MNCEELRLSVLDWVGREIDCHTSGDGALVATLPIFKPNGDAIEVGIEPTDQGRWKLSDLGETHATLYLAGVELHDEYVRAEEFRRVLSAHSISEAEQELSVEVSSNELIDGMFDFMHAIQSMLALQFTIRPQQLGRDFPSVVAKFFAENHASFEIPEAPIEGKSGKWHFNFILNHVKEETLVKALTARSKPQALKSAKDSVFEIGDVRAIRNARAVVIADDEGQRHSFWQPQVMRVFGEYEVPVYSFLANRDDLLQLAESYRAS